MPKRSFRRSRGHDVVGAAGRPRAVGGASIADGTALIRPVSLLNLSPDHTLVLMDGTRRHRSALVNLQLAPLGTVNQGSQAVDWAAFPAAAIERVEILRDGASAQYGSDATAGVINVILKDASEGLSFGLQYGEYYDGDGERLNITGEYTDSDITSRGVPRPDAAADREQEPVLQFLGLRHALTSPFGFNGGFWYLRLTASL
jgi:outer membrane receptor protein involved in Fe transport